MHGAELVVSVETAEVSVLDLEQLLRRESPLLLTYFMRRVDPLEDASDLLSQTMVVAWRRQSSIPLDETEARMWLFGVARKTLATHRRGVQRQTALGTKLREQLLVEGHEAGMSGHPHYRDVDSRTDALIASMARLKAVDRELLTLVHWDGFTLAECSALLDQRPATTRSRYSRARARLRALLLTNENAT